MKLSAMLNHIAEDVHDEGDPSVNDVERIRTCMALDDVIRFLEAHPGYDHRVPSEAIRHSKSLTK